MKSPTGTIWKTVVFAGAMLGSGTVLTACGGKAKNEMADPCKGDPCKGKMDPDGGDPYGGEDGAWGDDGSGYGDPDDGRPRGEGEGGDVGRGFVLN